MKQSQNAITFLRAQYRAVYGRAYRKGLASVMVLSSAVVGSYAQASELFTPESTAGDGDFNTAAQDALSHEAAELTAAIAKSEIFTGDEFDARSVLDSIPEWQSAATHEAVVTTAGAVEVSDTSAFTPIMARSNNDPAVSSAVRSSAPSVDMQGNDVLTASVLDGYAPVTPAAVPVSAEPRAQALAVDPAELPELGTSGVHNELTVGNTTPTKFSQGSQVVNTIVFQGGTLKLGDTVNSSGLDFTVSDVFDPDIEQTLTNKLEFNTESGDNIIDVAGNSAGSVTLDLTQTNISYTGSGSGNTTVNVGSRQGYQSATINIDQARLDALLQGNTSGTGQTVINLNSGGILNAGSKINVNLGDLTSSSSAGQVTPQQGINFNGGTLEVDSLTVVQDGKQADLGSSNLNQDKLLLSGSGNFAFIGGNINLTPATDTTPPIIGAANGETGQTLQIGTVKQTGTDKNAAFNFTGQDGSNYIIEPETVSLQSSASGATNTNTAAMNFSGGNWQTNKVNVGGINNSISVNGETTTFSGTDLNLEQAAALKTSGSGDIAFNNVTLNSGSRLNLGNDTFTVTGSGDFAQGNLAGTANVVFSGNGTENRASANLTATQFNNYLSGGGEFTLDGGADFTVTGNDEINLGQYHLDAEASGSGDIHVIAPTDPTVSNNTFTAENVAISQELTSDPTSLALDIHATTLTLGGDNYNDVNSDGIGTGALHAHNVNFADQSGAAGPETFVLRDELNLTPPATDTTGTGTISGSVILAGGPDNSLNIHEGNYTQNGDLSLASGSLQIGGDSNANTNVSLTVSGNVSIDNTAGSNVINVQANAADTTASLDFTGNELNVTRGDNLTTINVGNGAQFTVTGSQVTDKLLAGPATPYDTTLGAGVILDSGAEMVIAGASTLDVDTFQSGDAAQSDKIVFKNGGQVTVNGKLALTNTNNGVADFGAGTVAVKDGLLLSGSDANTDFVLGQGTLRVNVSNPDNALVSSANGNEVLTIGNGGASTGAAHLILDTGFRESNAQQLTVQSNLALNGNGANSATVTFRGNTTSDTNDPNYDANTDYNAQSINVSGDNNTINIGDGAHTATTLTAQDISLESGAALDVNIGDGTSTATLTAQNINLGDSSTLDLNNGAANVNNVSLSGGSTLNLNNESLTVTGSGDFTQGTLAGSGNLVVNGVDAQASFTDNKLESYLAGSGDVTLQSGADLNLSSNDPATPVNLNQFAFDDVDPAIGSTTTDAIHVVDDQNDATDNSRVTGENLLISSPLHDSDLALDIDATHLTLGDSNHNSADDTNGLGVDKLYAQGVTFIGYDDGAGNSGDFVLRDELNLSAVDNTNPQAPVAGTGNITGNVILAGGTDNGLNVLEGNYTQNNNVTLVSGSLTVGGNSTATTDASLAVTGDFKLDNTSGNNVINVQANGAGTEATLDLSQATASTVTPDTAGTNLTTINVGSTPADPVATPVTTDSHVKVTAELANNLLNGDAGAVNLGASGELDIGSGDVTLATDDLLSGATAAAGQVAFNNGGVLSADGLNLSGSGDLNIGSGTINANRLDLTNTTVDADATFAGGNFNIADELNSTNTNIVVGNGNNTTNVTLGAFTPDNDHTRTDAVISGSLGGNPGTISSNVVVNANASLNVQQGNWTLNNGSGNLTVNQGELVIGAINSAGNAYQVYDDQGSGTAVTAEITSNALNLSGANITVNSTGTANFDSLITDANSGSNVLVAGGTINVENDVSLNSGDSIVISGATGTVSFGSGAAHHITANADGSTLNVESGSFDNVFDLQSGGNLKLDLGDQTFSLAQIQELRKTLLADADASGTVMDPGEHGYIHLGGAQLDAEFSDRLVGVAISEYDPNNPQDSILQSGVDQLPSGSVPVILGFSASDKQTLEELADIKDIRTDILDDVLLYDINSDQAAGDVTVVTGNVGALMVTTGDHAVINEANLAHAYENGNSNGNRYFIASQADGTLLDATVQSGGLLNLENGGYIGEVVLEDGTSANDKTTLTINTRNPDKTYGSGDDGITHIEGNVSGGANTAFNVHDVTVVSGDVTIGEINNTSELDINGTTLTVNGGTFSNTNNITLNNGDVNHTGGDFTNSGAITGANNVNVTGGDITLGDSSSITAAGSGTFSGNTVSLGGTNAFGGDVTVTGNTIDFGTNTSITSSSGDLSFTTNSESINLSGSTASFSGNTIKFTANGGDVTLGTGNNLQGNNLELTGQKVTVAGNQDFAGNGTFTATNGSVTVNAGNQNFDQGATFSGTSISLNSGANVSSNGDLTFTGNTTQYSGSTLHGNNATFTGDTTLNGTNTFTGTGTFSGGNVTFAGQNSFGQGAEVNATTVNINAGSNLVAGSGSGNVTASGDIKFTGANHTQGSWSFTGTNINLAADSRVSNSGDLSFSGTTTQESGGRLIGSTISFNGDTNLGGYVTATTLNVGNGTTQIDNTLEVQNLNVDSGTTTLLGSNNKIDNLVVTAAAGGSGASNVVQFGTDDPNFSGQTTATVGTLQLNGNTLYTDPIYGKAATLVTIEQGQPYTPTEGSGSSSTTQTVLDGDLIIGKNSAVAWGAPTTGTNLLVNDVAPYQDANGSLQTGASGMYGSILVLNKPMVVADGSQIVLNSDSTTTGVDDTRAIATLADGREADLALSANSLLIVKVDAVGATDAQNTPAIHFDKQGAVITAASGSTIVLKGNYDLRTGIDVFTDGDASGSTGVELVGADVTVTSENGLLTSLLTEEPSNNVGHIQLRTTRDLINQKFNRVSNPVRDTLADYYNTTVNSAGTSNFLNGVLTTDSDGSSAEVAARMGVYGGAVQSALAVNDAATDAVARRTGVGEAAPGGSYFKASGPVDMWFNPVYQRNESDGFSAEGVDYGTDINLYGFNAGSELNLMPGLKVGAQINVGTGDAEGNGLASGVSNDFDYYGLGVYGALQTKNLTLVGDINYTKVSNDISANTHIDSLNTSVDSESLSLGVTGKLEYDVNKVKVMPHAGLRYQRLDMDDYNVNSTKFGQVAHYGADTLNLLSLPVGVTLYKNLITADGWHLKPAIDFTATWNFGDTDADGNVSWTGSTMHTGLSTEVLDPLTFGINAGISARKDRFTVGVGVSYTGSSNTSELGVQGNVKYTF